MTKIYKFFLVLGIILQLSYLLGFPISAFNNYKSFKILFSFLSSLSYIFFIIVYLLVHRANKNS